MRFSLILATLHRTAELQRFLESLDRQTYRNFELIVIDQNDDDRLVPILQSFHERFPIAHLRSETGLSRARNVGLEHANGDVMAFPDDDCWYPDDLLERVVSFFRNNVEWDGLTGRCVDEHGRVSAGRPSKVTGQVTRYNVWKRCTSVAIFLKDFVNKKTGRFDETLGLGSETPWVSAEEMDYVLRVVQNGFRIYYDPEITVLHPNKEAKSDPDVLRRSYSYAAAMGRVQRIHRYPLWLASWWWARACAGILISLLQLNPGRARFHLNALKGRISGWFSKV